MRTTLVILAILGGVLWAFGFPSKPAVALVVRAKQERQFLQVTVNRIPQEARWLSVYVCGAELQEDGSIICAGHYERESTMELDGLRSQAYVEWQRVPAGPVLVTAMAFDADQLRLASQTVTVFLR